MPYLLASCRASRLSPPDFGRGRLRRDISRHTYIMMAPGRDAVAALMMPACTLMLHAAIRCGQRQRSRAGHTMRVVAGHGTYACRAAPPSPHFAQAGRASAAHGHMGRRVGVRCSRRHGTMPSPPSASLASVYTWRAARARAVGVGYRRKCDITSFRKVQACSPAGCCVLRRARADEQQFLAPSAAR